LLCLIAVLISLSLYTLYHTEDSCPKKEIVQLSPDVIVRFCKEKIVLNMVGGCKRNVKPQKIRY